MKNRRWSWCANGLQRKLLRELATGPVPQRAWAGRVLEEGWPVLRGMMPVTYRALGRFRNALLLDEVQRRRPRHCECA